MKSESELKSELATAIELRLPGWMFLGHEDVRRCGTPDRTLTGRGITSWWEGKCGTPTFKSKGQQELTCVQLAGAGRCRYIIWMEEADGSNQRTLIVHPRELFRAPRLSGSRRDARDLAPFAEATFAGFDHSSVIEWMHHFHGGR